MSTRSAIAVVNKDNTISSVYCHFDGYPEGVGKCLVLAHNNEEDARKIIELGDISSLRGLLEPPTEGHSFETPMENVTIFYGRDRGDVCCVAKEWALLDDLIADAYDTYWAEYIYVWFDGKWHCYTGYLDDNGNNEEINLYDDEDEITSLDDDELEDLTVYLDDITGTLGKWMDMEYDHFIPQEVIKALEIAYSLSVKALLGK